MDAKWDVVIVGGGVAGLSAGLTLVRGRRRVIIVDGGAPRNRFAAHMHGVLGHDGKSPHQLIAEGRREVENYGGVIVDAQVTEVVRVGETLTLTIDSGATLHARRVIVATGLRDELPDIEGLAEQWGKGVVVCPYCDGYEVRDARIGILATSSWSPHQAQLLRQWSANITYFVDRTDPPEGDELRALRARGIEIEATPVARILSDDGRLTGIELDNGRQVGLDAIFTGPRPVPIDNILRQLGADLAHTPFGPFVVTDPTGKTSVQGVWAVGNVANMQANVPMSIGAGSFAAAAVNMDLITEDIARTVSEYSEREKAQDD